MDQDRARVQIVEAWVGLTGTPYFWGGKGPTGIDCSGLIEAGWRAAGVWPFGGDAPASLIYSIGVPVAWEDRLPGDVIGFGEGGVAHHVVGVLRVGDGRNPGEVIGANHGGPIYPGEAVTAYIKRMAAAQPRPAAVEIVSDDYWMSKRLGVRRAPKLAQAVDA